MKNAIYREIKDDRVVPNASVVLEPYKTGELADEARNCRSGHVHPVYWVISNWITTPKNEEGI